MGKEEWDKSDSEEEKPVAVKEQRSMKSKPKKKADEKIATRVDTLTEEEKIAEKLRMQKMEENSKIALVRELVGIKENKIDSLVPVTKEDFEQFGKAISEKIQMFSTSEHYSDLIENITKEICVDLKTPSLKKLKIFMDNLANAKQKQEKITKSKTKIKGIGVKMELEKDIYGGSIEEGFDDMDDFM